MSIHMRARDRDYETDRVVGCPGTRGPAQLGRHGDKHLLVVGGGPPQPEGEREGRGQTTEVTPGAGG